MNEQTRALMAAALSPFVAPCVALAAELEQIALRRKIQDEIAAAMGVPAEFLFNPLVQRVINGPTVDRAWAFNVTLRPDRIMRRKIRKAYGL